MHVLECYVILMRFIARRSVVSGLVFSPSASDHFYASSPFLCSTSSSFSQASEKLRLFCKSAKPWMIVSRSLS